jgi:hypothetical protein
MRWCKPANTRPGPTSCSTRVGSRRPCAPERVGRCRETASSAAPDLESVIIDRSFDALWRARLRAAVDPALSHCSWEGVARPQVLAGTVGRTPAPSGALCCRCTPNSPPTAIFS